jgi:hypothetical protein
LFETLGQNKELSLKQKNFYTSAGLVIDEITEQAEEKAMSPYDYVLNQIIKQGDRETKLNAKLINEDLIIVSYADSQMNHNGYIYQATNWIYTGATKERTDIGFEDGTHSRHYDKNIDYSIRKFRSSKHRYIFFIGKLRKIFRSNLKYKIENYPKGENKNYDSSYKPEVQLNLF